MVARAFKTSEKGGRPPHVFVVGRIAIIKLMSDELRLLPRDVEVNILFVSCGPI